MNSWIYTFICQLAQQLTSAVDFCYAHAKKSWSVVSLRPLAAECRDTEACDFQILTRFTQPHCLCSWSQSEICQNLDSNSAATLGPPAQVNYTIMCQDHYRELSNEVLYANLPQRASKLLEVKDLDFPIYF